MLFLLQVCAVEAQYIVSVPSTPTLGAYGCKITPNLGTAPFADLDLVTWIFPDGQYRQKEIKIVGGSIQPGTDTVQWRPYTNAPSGPNDIDVYVAKKGGTGNPGRVGKTFSGGNTSLVPASFYFPAGKTWQVNRSWEFSPNNETFLIVSYKPNSLPNCILGTEGVSLSFDPSKITLVDTYAFNNETVTPSFSGVDFKLTNIPNQIHKHVFFKLKATTKVGETIKIRVIGKVCSTIDTLDLRYETANGPHDPNKKTVDIDTICPNQPAIKLTYAIQYHNDGNAPVNKISVTDILPGELQPTSFALADVPFRSGASTPVVTPSGATWDVVFDNMNLPGLNQISPSYGYDQTIYRYTFNALTKANFNTTINNEARVTFYDSNNLPLLPIYTNVARVITSEKGGCYVPTAEVAALLGNVEIAPNPFYDRVGIALDLAEKSQLKVEVRDLHGRLVQIIAAGEYASGKQYFIWDSSTVSSGNYLLYLRTDKGNLIKKIVKSR